MWQLARIQNEVFSLINFNQIVKKTLIDKMKSNNQPFLDKGQVVFNMKSYIDSLFEVLKAKICPWVTLVQVECSVFWYIQNLIHKAESILID